MKFMIKKNVFEKAKWKNIDNLPIESIKRIVYFPSCIDDRTVRNENEGIMSIPWGSVGIISFLNYFENKYKNKYNINFLTFLKVYLKQTWLNFYIHTDQNNNFEGICKWCGYYNFALENWLVQPFQVRKLLETIPNKLYDVLKWEHQSNKLIIISSIFEKKENIFIKKDKNISYQNILKLWKNVVEEYSNDYIYNQDAWYLFLKDFGKFLSWKVNFSDEDVLVLEAEGLVFMEKQIESIKEKLGIEEISYMG